MKPKSQGEATIILFSCDSTPDLLLTTLPRTRRRCAGSGAAAADRAAHHPREVAPRGACGAAVPLCAEASLPARGVEDVEGGMRTLGLERNNPICCVDHLEHQESKS